MAKSPTENTLSKWRKAGYLCQVVEKWNPHARIRQDLYGFIDVLAVGESETVGIQTTSISHLSTRIKKIEDECFESVAVLRKAGWRIVVEGWHKPKHRWVCKEVDVS